MVQTERTGRLGVAYSGVGSVFRVFAEADSVRVRLLHTGTRRVVVRDMALGGGEDEGVWKAEVEGDWKGWSYGFEVERDGEVLGGVLDPWAELVHGDRAYVVDETTAVHPRPALEAKDAVIYELHVRDFTRDRSSGVRELWRGRYMGLTERGTVCAHDGVEVATGLDHILELGANVVQIMPVQSFSLPYHPVYEWGYMPNEFMSPHAGYASGTDLFAPVREMKQMVGALHAAGLRVTLDVVFNHTAELWPDTRRNFMALAPREYYRWKDDGEPWDGSACGNEFRSESPEGRRYIVEACKHWVREYGVDGFRFDLMGLIDEETMERVAREVHEIDETLLIYGEPWAGGPTGIEINGKGKQRGKGWGVFSDELRDSLRGEVFDVEDLGFLSDGRNAEAVKIGLLGGVGSFADSPLETINYIECHDDHTLHDRLDMVRVGDWRADEGEKLAMHKLGAMAVLTSQGIPFLHAGQDFARTKQGEKNSYNLGDDLNNIRWGEKAESLDLFEFYRGMVRMVREHTVFRMGTKEEIERGLRFFEDLTPAVGVGEGTIGLLIDDVTGTNSWARVAVVMNGGRAGTRMALPAGAWRVAVLHGAHEDGTREAGGAVELEGHSGAVLYEAR